MAIGRKIQRNQPTATSAPQTSLFKPRPFAAPVQSETASPPNLQAKLDSRPVSDRLSRVDFSVQPTIQPKLSHGGASRVSPLDQYKRDLDQYKRDLVAQDWNRSPKLSGVSMTSRIIPVPEKGLVPGGVSKFVETALASLAHQKAEVYKRSGPVGPSRPMAPSEQERQHEQEQLLEQELRLQREQQLQRQQERQQRKQQLQYKQQLQRQHGLRQQHEQERQSALASQRSGKYGKHGPHYGQAEDT